MREDSSGHRRQRPPPDIILRFQRPITELLLEFGDEVLDVVREQKGIDVDDVRAKMLGPLREYLHMTQHSSTAAAATAAHVDAGQAENASSTLPNTG